MANPLDVPRAPRSPLTPGPRISELLEEGETVAAVADLRAWGPALDQHRRGGPHLAPHMVALATDRRLLLFEYGGPARRAGLWTAIYYAELAAIRAAAVPGLPAGLAAEVTVVDAHGDVVVLGAPTLEEAQRLVDHVADQLLEVVWQRELPAGR